MAETKIDLGKKGVLVIANREYTPPDGDGKTYKYIDVRLHFKGKEDGKLYPTKQGITFRENQADDVVRGVQAAKAALVAGKTNTGSGTPGEDEPF